MNNCPLNLEEHERPSDCDPLTCEIFCLLYAKEKHLTYRGLRTAKRHNGTQEPTTQPTDNFRDKRFKKEQNMQEPKEAIFSYLKSIAEKDRAQIKIDKIMEKTNLNRYRTLQAIERLRKENKIHLDGRTNYILLD
jgi:hypothetical protein